MTDWDTVLLLIPSSLFSLALLALVLWPICVGVIEISKAIRSAVREPTLFILTNEDAAAWLNGTRNEKSEPASQGDQRLRLSVLFSCAMEAAFIVFLAVFLFEHADPRGDGMEMAGLGFAFMLIFLPFTLPAFIFARYRRWLLLAAGLAGVAAIAYFALWLELVGELGLPRS